MAIRARWKGGDPADGHLNGVPARSLDEAEFDALDAETRKLVRESPLYDVRTEAEMSPAKADEPKAADRK